VTGELDIATAPALGRALKHALLTARLVVLDLRDVAFIDSAGVHAILNADARARTLGQRLMILRAPATVDRIFGLSGAADQLEFVPVSMTPGSRTMRACPRSGIVLGGPCGLGILTRSSRDRSQ
jgi:anti-anti-sigma factor